MLTYHVYKVDCFTASRVLLQASWDERSIFLHSPGAAAAKHEGGVIESRRLSFQALFKALRARTLDERTFVFHAQSSLPHLFFARFVQLCFGGEAKIVYDIHDLHCVAPERLIYLRRPAELVRYLILGLLERFALRDRHVRPMTVSRGLARILEARSRRPVPVVYSAPPPLYTEEELSSQAREEKAVLFFGTPERTPLEIFDQIRTAGYELHIYGRGITKDYIENKTGRPLPASVRLFGPYAPTDMSFVAGYRYVVLYKPDHASLNFRYSLPNKFFQGLAHGAAFIFSENFVEMIDMLAGIPGAAVVLDAASASALDEALADAEARRRPEFWAKVSRLSARLNDEARASYHSVLGSRVGGHTVQT
jgi:hypothetical protein